jgi:hypothetical protein
MNYVQGEMLTLSMKKCRHPFTGKRFFPGIKYVPAAAALVLLLAPSPSAADTLYRRNLNCDQQSTEQAARICRVMEQEIEWTWLGHAIISPGYRMTLASELKVYCKLPIRVDDTATLIAMSLHPEYRANAAQVQVRNGARGLLKMLGQRALDRFPDPAGMPKTIRASAQYLKDEIALAIRPDSSSVYAPSHPAYILRHGCRN